VSSRRPEDGVGVRVLCIILFAGNLLGALRLRKAYWNADKMLLVMMIFISRI